ncbi:NMDA receptor-regulated protein 2 [Myotis brandtii]|uniref:NMDA receptor-regulated protein 2 n=1 Tax=Myotis brandtii TaxID=109478 RepID=S7MKA4_MYOBR|nr:NMDA receptor-regulated protein 2 [Myotis brandtii]
MSSVTALSEPRLNWDVASKNGLKTFFSRENYKDHSMAPSLKELCNLSNRRIGENLNASASSVENEPAVSSATQAKENVKATVGMVLLPKPRVPYPRFSRFSQREQRSYVDLLVKYAKISANSKAVGINKNDYLQYLDMKNHVNEEVTEFLKFLQNSAKKCAQDYNMLSDDARLFTEIAADFSILENQKEFVRRYCQHHEEEPRLPLLTSACPGWDRYAERVLGHLCMAKSPQQIMGSLVKDYFARWQNLSPDKISHVIVALCYDKKLGGPLRKCSHSFA